MRVPENFDAIDVRHLDIGNDQIEKIAVNLALRRLARLHGFDAVSVTAQSDIKHFADGAFVVADQNVSHAASLLPQPWPVARWAASASGFRSCCQPRECE